MSLRDRLFGSRSSGDPDRHDLRGSDLLGSDLLNSIAARYHRRTKYTQEALLAESPLDVTKCPPNSTRFPSDRPVELAPHLPYRFARGAADPPVSEDGPLAAIARTLFFSYGATGYGYSPDGGTRELRATPSSGGLHPIELYFASAGVDGLTDGVYRYESGRSRLWPVFDGDLRADIAAACFDHPANERALGWVILTARYERVVWRFRDRAYRRVLLDAGHVIGNLVAYAKEESLAAVPVGCFLDRRVNRLLFLDGDVESTLMVCALVPRAEADADALVAPSRRASDVTPEEDDRALYLQLHRGSSLRADATIVSPSDRDALPPRRGRSHRLTGELGPLGGELASTIARRRSTRAFSGGAIGARALGAILDHGWQAVAAEPYRVTQAAEFLAMYVVVLNVDGVAPGVYEVRRDRRLIRVRKGDFHREITHAALGQPVVESAAAVVVHTADLAGAVARYGERAYRALHLDTGYVGQHLHLAATHLGVGVSGVGGYYDDDVAGIVDVPGDQPVLYLTILGEV